MVFVQAGKHGDELALFRFVQGRQEFRVDGGELRVTLQECLFTFFSEAEKGGAPVVDIGSLFEEAFCRQPPGDLDAGRSFDEHLVTELFFVGVIHDGRLDEYGKLLGFGKAEVFDDGFAAELYDAMKPADEEEALGGAVEVGWGFGWCWLCGRWLGGCW